MHKIHFFLATLLLLSAASCQRKQGDSAVVDGDTIALRYAKNLTIVKRDGYTEVSLADPWHSGKNLCTYLLVERGADVPKRAGTIVRVPLERALMFTSAHSQLLCDLGAMNQIGSACDAKYILNETLQQRIRSGAIVDCGDAMAPNYEKIVVANPDAILLSPFENSGFGRLETMQIPLIFCADYMEGTPLGRAEWMIFYGMLVGKEREARERFAQVAATYSQLKARAQQLGVGRKVLTERKTGSVWYCPAGRSPIAQIIRDANGVYPFADDEHAGSLSLTAEEVIGNASDCDVWLIKYHGKRPLSKHELLAEYHGYNKIKAFQTGTVFQCNTTETPYFDEVSFRPDLLLREMMIILHPNQQDLGRLRYYSEGFGAISIDEASERKRDNGRTADAA